MTCAAAARNRRRGPFAGDVALLLALAGGLLLLLALGGCSTVSRNPVEAKAVAWVDDKQDAGIVRFGLDPDGTRIGLVVRPGYIANYDRLLAAYGAKVARPVHGREGVFLRPDGLYFIDGEHAAAEMEMERMDHAAAK